MARVGTAKDGHFIGKCDGAGRIALSIGLTVRKVPVNEGWSLELLDINGKRCLVSLHTIARSRQYKGNALFARAAAGFKGVAFAIAQVGAYDDLTQDFYIFPVNALGKFRNARGFIAFTILRSVPKHRTLSAHYVFCEAHKNAWHLLA